MSLSVLHQDPGTVEVDVLAVGVFGPTWRDNPWLVALDRALDGGLFEICEAERFDGVLGSTTSITGMGKLGARRVLLVGLGGVPPSPQAARLLGVAAARFASERGSVAVAAPADDRGTIAAACEGLVTGAYRYAEFLSEQKPRLERMVVLTREASLDAADEVVHRARITGELVNLARDLVNTPPNVMTPAGLAEACVREAAGCDSVSCTVYDDDALTKMDMRLLLAVGAGSREPSRLIHLHYDPGLAGAPRVALVGKGVSYDSGGLCIKPHEHLPMMKLDMAGAAVALSMTLGAARLGLPVEIDTVIASAENMTGGGAMRPGDIIRSKAGPTVEIVNTDAEGRLVLADAIAFAKERDPGLIVDFGTLTGTAVLAMGFNIGALFSSSDDLAGRYLRAAGQAGESLWRFPLSPELEPTLRSTVADLRHAAPMPMGSTITCALFLRRFVRETPWLHLDIAGPSHLQFPVQHPLHPNGGTGYGVMTGLRFLEEYAANPEAR